MIEVTGRDSHSAPLLRAIGELGGELTLAVVPLRLPEELHRVAVGPGEDVRASEVRPRFLPFARVP